MPNLRRGMRAQAATEFLMTYGWAILAVAVALVTLYDLSVFTGTVPNSCIATTGYVCVHPILYSNGTMNIGFGQVSPGPITVIGTACTNSSMIGPITSSGSLTLEPDERQSLSFSCPSPATSVGGSFHGYLWIEYNVQSGPQDVIEMVGRVSATVQHISGTTGPSGMAYAITSGEAMYSANLITDAVTNTLMLTNPNNGTTITLAAIALSPNGKYAYVGTQDAYNTGLFFTVNLNTDTVANVISGAFAVSSIAVSSDGSYAYAVGLTTPYSLDKISLATNTIVSSVSGFVTGGGVAALSPNGQYAYVGTGSSATYFYTVNLISQSISNTMIWSGGYPEGIALSPDGQNAYVISSAELTTVNLATDTISNTITSPFTRPMGIALSPNGQYAYVIDQMNKALYTVNVGTDTISNTLSGIWSDPLGVALSPDGSYAYVANSAGSNGLYVVDLNSDVVVNSIATIGASQVAVYS